MCIGGDLLLNLGWVKPSALKAPRKREMLAGKLRVQGPPKGLRWGQEATSRLGSRGRSTLKLFSNVLINHFPDVPEVGGNFLTEDQGQKSLEHLQNFSALK